MERNYFTFDKLIEQALRESKGESYDKEKLILKIKDDNKKWTDILYLFNITPSNLKKGNKYQFSARTGNFVKTMLKFYNSKTMKKYRSSSVTWFSSDSFFIRYIIKWFRQIMIETCKSEEVIEQQTSDIITRATNCFQEEYDKYKLELNSIYMFITNIFNNNFHLNTPDQIFVLNKMREEFIRNTNSWSKKWKELVAIMSDLRADECTNIDEDEIIEINQDGQNKRIYDWSIFGLVNQNLNNDEKYNMTIDQISELKEKQNRSIKDETKLNRLCQKASMIEAKTTKLIFSRYKIEIPIDRLKSSFISSQQLYINALADYMRPDSPILMSQKESWEEFCQSHHIDNKY